MEPTQNVNPSREDIDAFRQQPDDDAIIMVNLLRFNGEEGRKRYGEYAKVSGQEIAERGGRVIYSARNAVGPGVPWDSVALVYYPRREAWLSMQDSPAYQAAIEDRTAGLSARLLYAFRSPTGVQSFDDIPSHNDTEIAVVNLLRYNGDEGKAEYQQYGRVASGLINETGGEVLLHLEADYPLVSDYEWQNLILVRYPSLEALMTMVQGETWKAADRDHRQKGMAGTIALPTRQNRPR
tara:strand:- start:6662 stop:7375 length:714 start_codon:yes stop_codon:yes gene_type:complete